MSNKEILPCPFCGGETKIDNRGQYVYGIVCISCGAKSPDFQTETNAIKSWNDYAKDWLKMEQIETQISLDGIHPDLINGVLEAKRNYPVFPDSCKKSCKDENTTCKKNLQLTRSYIEQMVKPIEWNGWRGKLEAFSFSIIENEMSAFEVCFGKDCLNGHYIDTSSTIDGAKELAQAFLVDLICSALGVEE